VLIVKLYFSPVFQVTTEAPVPVELEYPASLPLQGKFDLVAVAVFPGVRGVLILKSTNGDPSVYRVST